MVNPITPCKTLSISFTVRQILIFMLALTSVYLAKSVFKYKKKHWKTMTLWNITEHLRSVEKSTFPLLREGVTSPMRVNYIVKFYS